MIGEHEAFDSLVARSLFTGAFHCRLVKEERLERVVRAPSSVGNRMNFWCGFVPVSSKWNEASALSGWRI